MTIKTITIQGYRSVQNLQLNLGQINVVTGPNGCGKSNLYKAVYLLAQAAKGELAKTLALEGGMPSVLWAGKKHTLSAKKPVRFMLSVNTDKYNFEIACGLPSPGISAFDLDPLVKEEYVWFGDKRRASNTFLERHTGSAWIYDQKGKKTVYPATLSQSESVLSQLQEPHLYPELSILCGEMKKWRFYHNFLTEVESSIRTPQVGVRTPILNNDGKDLAAALQTIIEIGNVDLLHEIVDHAFPGSKLIINIDEKTRFEVMLQMPGILRPLEARELSDGTLRFLCLVAALLSPRPAPLLALNEPEMSLHPDLIQPLAELITMASQQSQIWVTTHSKELAKKISKTSGEKTINLIMTENGTQNDEKINSWESYVINE